MTPTRESVMELVERLRYLAMPYNDNFGRSMKENLLDAASALTALVDALEESRKDAEASRRFGKLILVALFERDDRLDKAEQWMQHKNFCMKLDCYDERNHGCTCGLDEFKAIALPSHEAIDAAILARIDRGK